MRHMGGKLVRCKGIVRTTFALTVNTANYNFQRLVYLKKRAGLPAF
jgi:IS5 family transposase